MLSFIFSLSLQQSLSVSFSRGEAGVEKIVNLVKSTYLVIDRVLTDQYLTSRINPLSLKKSPGNSGRSHTGSAGARVKSQRRERMSVSAVGMLVSSSPARSQAARKFTMLTVSIWPSDQQVGAKVHSGHSLSSVRVFRVWCHLFQTDREHCCWAHARCWDLVPIL